MNKIVNELKSVLKKSGVTEVGRRVKQRIKRNIRKDDVSSALVPTKNIFDHNPMELEELIVINKGSEATVDYKIYKNSTMTSSSIIEVNYSINSLDYEENWFKLEITSENENGMDLREFDGLGLNIAATGSGGQFLFSINDYVNGQFSYNSSNILFSNSTNFLSMDFYKFFKPPWNEEKSGNKVFGNVKSIEITVKPGDTPIPHKGIFRILSIAALSSVNSVDIDDLKIKSVKTIDDLTQGIEDRFFYTSGNDSDLSISQDKTVKFQGRPTLKVNYSLKTNNHGKNWLTLFRDLNEAVNMKDFIGILLFIKGNKSGETLRITIRNKEGNELIYDHNKVLRYDDWKKIYIPIDGFIPPFWKKAKVRDFDFGSITQVSFSYLYSGKNLPFESFMNFGGIFFVKDIKKKDNKVKFTNEIPLIDDIFTKNVSNFVSNYPITIEIDEKGKYALLVLVKNNNKIEIKEKFENRYILDSDYIFLKMAELPENNLKLKITSPTGEDYISSVLYHLNYGSDTLILSPIEEFKKNETGIKFTDSTNSIGFIKEISLEILELKTRKTFIKLRQIGLASGDIEFDKKIESDFKTKPIIEEKKAIPIKTIEFKLKPSKVTKSDLSPLALKKEDDKSGGEYGLCRVAMFIEPTNLCNLRCIMCNHGDNSFKRGLGVMKFKDFKRITDELRDEKVSLWEFAPFWLGESFIHPQIKDFLNEANILKTEHNGMKHYNLHTNGVNLTEKHLQIIAESSLDSILFSIDAAKEVTYDKIRKGGNFKNVVSSVEKLLEIRNKLGKSKPAIITQFIVMDENEKEIKEFYEFWKTRGIKKLYYGGCAKDNPFIKVNVEHNLLFPQTPEDSVFIKSLEPNAKTKHQNHREVVTEVEKNPKWRFACQSLFRMMAVGWDGTATACCRDDQLDMPIGNVLKEGTIGVWYGEKLRELRLKHIMGDFDSIPKCKECFNWVKSPLHNSEIIHWLKSIGREDLVAPYLARIKNRD